MGFIDDIARTFGGDFSFGNGFCCTLSDSAGYFEKVSAIISYSEEEVVLSLKGGTLTVSGKGLYIKKYCEGDVAVCGKITGLKRE